MATRMECAWAAGFIDGEGCFSGGINSRGTVITRLVVTQRDRLPLDHLQGLFGGSIAPVVNKGNPAFILTITRHTEVLQAIKAMRPYLRCKADQADALAELTKHLVKHGGRGRYHTIDKTWCAMKCTELQMMKKT